MKRTKPTLPFTKREAISRLRGAQGVSEDFAKFLSDIAAYLADSKGFRSGPRPKRPLWGRHAARHMDKIVKDAMLELLHSGEVKTRADAYTAGSKSYSYLPATLRKFNSLVRKTGIEPRAK